jgi:hypothetical protein
MGAAPERPPLVVKAAQAGRELPEGPARQRALAYVREWARRACEDGGAGDAVPACTVIHIDDPDSVLACVEVPIYEGAIGDAHKSLIPGEYIGVTAECGDAVRLTVHENRSSADYDTGR